MLNNVITQLIRVLAGAAPLENKIYTLTDQQPVIFNDLRRALNPANKRDQQDVKLGTPVKKEVTAGTSTVLLEQGNPASIAVKTIEIANLSLRSDVLILRFTNFSTNSINVNGKIYSLKDLAMDDGQSKATGTGRTLFSVDLMNKGDGIPIKNDFVKTDYPPANLIIVLYRETALKEAFFVGNSVVEATTQKLTDAATSVTLLHELFVHAIPAAIKDMPFYEDNYPNKALAVSKEKIDKIDARGFAFSNK